MAFPILAVFKILGAIGGLNLVSKTLTNLAAGTKNKIDDAVVLAIVTAAKLVGGSSVKIKAATEAINALQKEYSDLKATDPAKLEELKKPSSEDVTLGI